MGRIKNKVIVDFQFGVKGSLDGFQNHALAKIRQHIVTEPSLLSLLIDKLRYRFHHGLFVGLFVGHHLRHQHSQKQNNRHNQ